MATGPRGPDHEIHTGDDLMKLIVCERCGGSSFIEHNGYRVCEYCNSKFMITNNETKSVSSSIALSDDVHMLLQKCRDNPRDARKYAGLVLDIDPGYDYSFPFM